MGLREYRQQQRQNQQGQQQQNQGHEQGTTWFDPYPQPLQGEVAGNPVLVLQIGDKPGSSDVFKCVDADNVIATVKEEDLKITGISVQSIGAFISVDAALMQQLRGRSRREQ